MPQWKNSTRRDRLPPDWSRTVKRIMRRDNRMCQWRLDDGTLCLAYATDVDHIRRGDDHRDSNLRALCGMHHQRKSSQEGGQAAAAKKRRIAKRYLRTEEHPGLI